MNSAVAYVHEQLTPKKEFPNFKAGDNITVNYKIVEGNKERIQSFKGDVIKRQGTGQTATFTVRKISDGVGVERVFPIFSPNIESILLHKVGKVRRAKAYQGVEKAYAIQAGRELRVIVEADKVTDGDSDKLSFEIAQKIQTEMTYPGQIKVTVIREKRAVNVAR